MSSYIRHLRDAEARAERWRKVRQGFGCLLLLGVIVGMVYVCALVARHAWGAP